MTRAVRAATLRPRRGPTSLALPTRPGCRPQRRGKRLYTVSTAPMSEYS